MTLKELVRREYDTFAEAIAWTAIWKEGRSWNCKHFWPEENPIDDILFFKMDEKEFEQVMNCLEAHPDAILVNAYYCNMGSYEEMTKASLADGIKWQYENKFSPLADYVDIAKDFRREVK